MAVNLVDVDVALDDRYVYAGGSKHAVRVGPRRPDYLLLANDSSTHRRYRVRALECKGTKNLSHAFQQLASAVEQLDGITVGGRTPTGLAVSTVSADDQMRYLALDPTDEDEPSYEVGTEIMQEVDEFRFRDDVRNIPSQVLTSAWLRASWAMLADFGGNLEAVGRWAPEVVQRRRDRRTRQRVSYETPYGTARGTSVSFDFEGQLLTVKYGIEATLDRRLSGPTAEPVIEAQGAFAERLSVYRRAAEPTDPRELHSATTDGSIFSLTLK